MKLLRDLMLILFLLLTCSFVFETRSQADFLSDFPKLSELTFKEPESPLRLGLGITPVGIMKDKTYLGASLIQAHWFSSWLDWEIGSIWIGFSNARNTYADSRSLMARTSPKLRILENLSLGPVGGYELVTFPDAHRKIFKGRFFTPEEPFSSRGWVYGGMLSLTFKAAGGVMRVSPLYLVRTYPYKSLSAGWQNYFTNPELQTAAFIEELAPESIVAIEMGIML